MKLLRSVIDIPEHELDYALAEYYRNHKGIELGKIKYKINKSAGLIYGIKAEVLDNLKIKNDVSVDDNNSTLEKENKILLKAINDIYEIADSFEWHYNNENTPQGYIYKKTYETLKEVNKLSSYKYFADQIAKNDLINNSVCIKTPLGIEKITNITNTQDGQLVFVSNISPDENNPIEIIKRGKLVRYRYL